MQCVYGFYFVINCGEYDIIEYKFCILQVFLLDNGDLIWEIWYYQYLSWFDYGVFSEFGGVFSFLDQINQWQESLFYVGFIIVYCSVGIGCIGIIIVIDMFMENIFIKGLDCDIDIQKIIQMVWVQCLGMVQMEVQYKFIYVVIVQFIEIIKKKLEVLQLQKGQELEYGNIIYFLVMKNVYVKVFCILFKYKEDVYENLYIKNKREEKVKKQWLVDKEKSKGFFKRK